MSSEIGEYPFEIKELEQQWRNKFGSLMPPEKGAFVIGPKRYLFINERKDILPKIYNMTVKPGDIFGLGLLRSGTTWSQELIWLLANDLNFEKAKNTPFLERFAFLEYTGVPAKYTNKVSVSLELDQLMALGSRRFIKTHLPLSLLPPSLLDTAKVVYIARDPRDVVVSLFHISTFFLSDPQLQLKRVWKNCIENLYPQYFDHVKEAWELRNHPNMLFLFYEDMSKDLPGTIRKMATFFGKQLTDDQVEQLKDHLTFENMKNHVDLTSDAHKRAGQNFFIRKGKVGGWREEFDEEMIAEADVWIEENLRDTDLRLPQQQ